MFSELMFWCRHIFLDSPCPITLGNVLLHSNMVHYLRLISEKDITYYHWVFPPTLPLFKAGYLGFRASFMLKLDITLS